MRLTRRQVFAAMAAGPALAAGGAGVAWQQWWDRAPGAGLRVLASDEHAFVDALAEAWMPPGGGVPALSGREARLGDFFDAMLAGMSGEQQRELKGLLQVLDDLPRLTRASPFRALDLHARTAVLDGWIRSDQWLLRSGALAIVTLMGGGYTTHPDVADVLQPWFRCPYGR